MKKFILTTLLLSLAVSSYAQTYTVEQVIDSATLQLTGGEIVRLIGLDAPENAPQEAAEFVRNIVGDWKQAKVRLEFDAQEKDEDGRLLAYVYLYQCAPGCRIDADAGYTFYELDDGLYLFLNETILGAGYGSPVTLLPNVTHADQFVSAYEQAREQKRGIWADTTSRLDELMGLNGTDKSKTQGGSLEKYFDRGRVKIGTSF